MMVLKARSRDPELGLVKNLIVKGQLKDKVIILKSKVDRIYPLENKLIIQVSKKNYNEDIQWSYCILIACWVLGIKNLSLNKKPNDEESMSVNTYLSNTLIPTSKLIKHRSVTGDCFKVDRRRNRKQISLTINNYNEVANDFNVPVGAVFYKQRTLMKI